MKPNLFKLRAIAVKKPKAIAFMSVLIGLVGISLIPKMSGRALSPEQCLSKPYEVLAEYDHYQVIQEVQESHGHHHQEILVSVIDGICSRLNVELDGMDYPFARYIDKEAAIQLNQQLWEKRMEDQGGKATFEKGFAEFASQPAFQTSRNEKPKPPEAIYMPFDKYEALQRLGVKIPANVKPANEPQFADPASRKPTRNPKTKP